MQLDIEDRAFDFEIQQDDHGFKLVDRSTFNNWGTLKPRFLTRDLAVDYARRCDAFKRGRRMQIEFMPWESA